MASRPGTTTTAHHAGDARTIFGRKLRAARQKSGLTQAEIARLADLAQPDVSVIERGCANPTIETMERLAAAVSMPLHVLLRP